MKKFNKNIARLRILNFITNHSLVKSSENFVGGIEPVFNAKYLFKSLSLFDHKEEYPIGCIVTPDFVIQDHKWYLGWLLEVKEINGSSPEYLIESVEDGSICRFSNCGLSYMPYSKDVDNWRWEDTQFIFENKVRKAINKIALFSYKYAGLEFDNKDCTIKIREYFSDKIVFTVKIGNWKTSSMKKIQLAIEESRDLVTT